MKRWQKGLAAVAGLLVLTLALGPFLIPVPPLTNLQEARALADPDSRFVHVPLGSDDLEVHYKEMGEGEPALILLHGFGASVFSWREVMAPLSASHRVIAFDRPAFGLTERPMRGEWATPTDWANGLPYSAEAQAELTINLLDVLGVNKAVLVGNSAGGTIAILAALKHPERVQALVLISPAVYSGGPNALVQWLLRTPQMQHIGPLIARRIQDWGIDFARTAWHDPERITDEIWAGYTAPLRVKNWDKALWELTNASRANNLPAQLERLTLPVLVITGDDDRIVPTEQSVRLAQELPNASLAIIPACGHVAHEECPEATLEAIEPFLASLN